MERLELTLVDIAHQGEALGRQGDQIIFVSRGIPGEEVVVEIFGRRRRYLLGEAVEIRSPSPHRQEPRCPYFGRCGGCQWQHIEYEFQLELKRRVVLDQLHRVGGFTAPPVLPPIPCDPPWHYRNHARFSVNSQGQLGFVQRESHKFIPIDFCYLMHPWINQALEHLQGKCAETSQVAVRYGVKTGDWLIQPKLKSPEISLSSGQPFYEEELLGHRFRISAASFFQVNTLQAEKLVGVVREQLEKVNLLVDAYAGVGTFAVLFSPLVERVIAIEESASAREDAAVNIAGRNNVDYRQKKTEEALIELKERPDAVILDPPRVGCDRKAIEALLRLLPEKIVYVSCDPGTLARDLKRLCEGGYRLLQVQPVDMFPQTYHIECVATLVPGEENFSGKGNEVVLASTSPRRQTLLSLLGFSFQIVPPRIEEPLSFTKVENPGELAEQLARSKARAIKEEERVVIGADTLVIHRGIILGKPRNAAEAEEMLLRLRGEEHQVITGVAALDPRSGRLASSHTVTRVFMRHYSDSEIQTYLRSGDPWDKAGAYAIQDTLFNPVASFEGCYFNVVGLPLCTLVRVLREVGIEARPLSEEALAPECRGCPERNTLTGQLL